MSMLCKINFLLFSSICLKYVYSIIFFFNKMFAEIAMGSFITMAVIDYIKTRKKTWNMTSDEYCEWSCQQSKTNKTNVITF